jgi:TRAP-type transport system small permease protein
MRRLELAMRQVLGTVAGVVLASMMLLTALDVFMRYVLSKPLSGAFETTEIMLAMLIFAGLPIVSDARQHIVIDTLEGYMSKGLRRALDALANAICMLVFGGVSFLIFKRAMRMMSEGDTTSVLKLPLYPVAYFMAALLLITALVHLALMFSPPPEEDGGNAL